MARRWSLARMHSRMAQLGLDSFICQRMVAYRGRSRSTLARLDFRRPGVASALSQSRAAAQLSPPQACRRTDTSSSAPTRGRRGLSPTIATLCALASHCLPTDLRSTRATTLPQNLLIRGRHGQHFLPTRVMRIGSKFPSSILVDGAQNSHPPSPASAPCSRSWATSNSGQTVAYNEGQPNQINHVVVSTSGGASWSAYVNVNGGVSYSGSLSMSNSGSVLALSQDNAHYVSTNSGQSWTAALQNPCKTYQAPAMSGDGSVMYAFAMLAGNCTLYRSSNTGATWAPLATNAPTFGAAGPVFGGSIFATNGTRSVAVGCVGWQTCQLYVSS